MIKEKVIKALEKAVQEVQKDGFIAVTKLPELIIERPQNIKYGDYASSIALKLARTTGKQPIQIANKIVEYLKLPEIEKVTVLPPGFINFTLSKTWLSNQVETILTAAEAYGNLNMGDDQSVQVEFVSVNPTGPLHIGHGRGAVMGSTLANVLNAAGYKVQKEYYINDAGTQLDIFKRSLFIRYKQSLGIKTEMPDDGYMGDYMIDMAKDIINSHDDRFLNIPESESIEQLGAIGVNKIMENIRSDLELLGVSFDVWFSEKSLNTTGIYDKIMTILKEKGYVAEKGNAVWFVSTALGEDKDNVLVRSDGTPTYFAYDIAYHFNKLAERKFSTAIDIWGADHHGHVARMKAVMNALGIDPDRLKIIITQLVTLKRGEQTVRVSKRSGDIITLRELVDEVGSDACRFVFLSRSADSQMDFDLELAKKQSSENPVYYVQYAHARISSILKLAEGQSINYSDGDVLNLIDESELELIKQMLKLPEIIELVAASLEPHHLPHYAQELATSFHSFYKQCRVMSDNEQMTHARLKLVKAAQIVLARTLHLMGMVAPESM